ncbi:MAG: ABC transporter substrate-binding protein [Mobilicoccus sp.]|nr:ABC transporter substrate-binding protein [Mobilicoccus sp.]
MRCSLVTALTLLLPLTIAACGTANGDASAAEPASAEPATVTVSTKAGDVEVPRHPQRVVALDSTSFETLQAFGITPVAAPKQLLPKDLNAWKDDANILDVGTHREPKLEVVAQAQPDLIIGGKRFEKVTADLQKAGTVIDIAPSTEQEGYVEALKQQTTTLGEIFGQETKAAELNDALDSSIERAAAVSTGQSVFLANHNGGKIDNAAGRIGVLLQPLDMTDVFDTEANSESIHQDSGLAPETVAQENPDVMIVMDRDAAVSTPGGEAPTPASRTVEAQTAWANTTFVQNNDIIYLRDTFYVTEGIQAYTDAYTQIAETLGQ